MNATNIWKNSAWLGTGIMIDRETPLAEIVGQMSLSRSTNLHPVLLDNDICPTISASGVSLSIIMQLISLGYNFMFDVCE